VTEPSETAASRPLERTTDPLEPTPDPLAQTADPLVGLVSLEDLEPLAAERLSPVALAYVSGGSWDEWTLAENVAAFRRRRLLPRILTDVSAIDTGVELLGRTAALPIGLAPAAEQGLCHPDAELASARAAAAAGVPFVLSTFSTASLEEVAAAVPEADRWFQLYVHRDRGITSELVARAASAGYRVLVVTVDLAVIGYRQREIEGGDTPAPRLGSVERYIRPGATLQQVLADHIDPSFDWDDLERLAAESAMPVVVKGVLRADDASRAVAAGARGVVVSNHGGRQLDRAPAAIDALESIVREVAGDAEVYLDSGIRRGLDVATAIALGARSVFVGRPYLWALAVDGERGVARVLAQLRIELETAMALLGAPTLADLDRSLVVDEGS
jgi:isopentenyl diphosphate isomerase/L-lactate dehydrogenase-like FMN-dependent dehydrogenase